MSRRNARILGTILLAIIFCGDAIVSAIFPEPAPPAAMVP